MATVDSISLAGGSRGAPGGEAALIRAAQERDHDAFEQLVRLYDRSVLRVALNVLRSEEDARDAYQEAFLKAYRSIGTFRFQCSFHTWLYRIVTNVCLDQLRRKSVRKEQTVASDPEAERLSPLDIASDERPGADPGRIMDNNVLSSRITEALDLLTPKERMVFELKHHEGLRLRAIGEMLSISEEAAKNCLFRATRKLRGALGEARAHGN